MDSETLIKLTLISAFLLAGEQSGAFALEPVAVQTANRSTITDGAGQNLRGRVGINIFAGTYNQQSNTLSIAAARHSH